MVLNNYLSQYADDSAFQYADDSALILGDDQNSLEQALNIFDCFSVCAGLRVNLDKTEAIWVG